MTIYPGNSSKKCRKSYNQHDDFNSSETFHALPGLNTPPPDVSAGRDDLQSADHNEDK